MCDYLTAAVEGPIDEVILRKLAGEFGLKLAAIHGRRGKAHLRKQIHAYNRAARHARWTDGKSAHMGYSGTLSWSNTLFHPSGRPKRTAGYHIPVPIA